MMQRSWFPRLVSWCLVLGLTAVAVGAPERTWAPGSEDDVRLSLEAGGAVRLGPGEFIFEDSLVLSVAVELVGSGSDATVLRIAGGPAAIAWVGAGVLTVRGVTVTVDGAAAIDALRAEAGTVYLEDVALEQALGSGLVLAGSARGSLTHTVVRSNGGNGVFVVDDAELTMVSCSVHRNGLLGIAFVDRASGTVRGSDVESNGMHGIGVADEAQAVIEESFVSLNAEVGIALFGATSSEVRSNTVVGNQEVGIGVGGSATSVVIENDVSLNRVVGIAFVADAGGVALRNRVTQNGAYGLYLEGRSEVAIEGNVAERNGASGIACTGNAAGHVAGNEVRGHPQYGIWIAATAHCTEAATDGSENRLGDVVREP